jgi:uncharacterized OB-fold protein
MKVPRCENCDGETDVERVQTKGNGEIGLCAKCRAKHADKIVRTPT